MNDKKDLKKIGIVTIIVSSILISIKFLHLAFILKAYSGDSLLFEFTGVNALILTLMCLFCAISKIKPSDRYYKKNIKGILAPLCGVVYSILLLIAGLISGAFKFIPIALFIGYILVLIHNTSEIKQVRSAIE